MKKLITVILILALLLPAAACAEVPDISGLSYEELLALNAAVQQAIFANAASVDGVKVPIGEYIIGEDIPAGTYRLEFPGPEDTSFGYIYIYGPDESETDSYLTGKGYGVEAIGKIVLEEGMKISIGIVAAVFRTYTGLFN